MKKYFEIKEPDVSLEEFQKLQPALAIVFNYFLMYADLYSLPVTVTSISEKVVGRKSRTHEEFRAIDISLKNWNEIHVKRLQHRINSIYKHWATGPVNGQKRVMVTHDAGSGYHTHLQIRRNISLEDY
jgi:hypothetical protein